MKNTKRVFGLYPAWGYQNEIFDLNKMSENGWQLTKGGLFSNKFLKNENVRYLYQLDYNTHIDDNARYIETFREQGWEYINSTINGWHYFRKLYNPSLPAEEYEIYCDRTSLKEMHDRWCKLAAAFSGILFVLFILELISDIRYFCIPTTITALTLLAEFIMIFTGFFKLKKNDGNSAKSRHKITAPMVILLCGCILTLFTLSFRPDGFTTSADYYGPVSTGAPVDMYEVNVSYPDNYPFEIEGTLAAPATISLVEKKTGNVIFTERLEPSSENKVSFKRKSNYLKRGNYSLLFSDYEGGNFSLKISF